MLLDNILNKIFIFNYQTRAGNLLNFYTQLTKRWRHDNLFLLEDGTYAIVDYESELKKLNNDNLE